MHFNYHLYRVAYYLINFIALTISKELILKYLSKDSLAKCIDGSLPAYYIRYGVDSGINKWIIYFQGGGWCYDIESCLNRSKKPLGSSKEYPSRLKRSTSSILYDDSAINPMTYNWNTVDIRYCDGTSFAGNTTKTYKNQKLYFYGKINRDETIKQLLIKESMINASEIIISGRSAGALAVYLGIDHISNMINKYRKNILSSAVCNNQPLKITGLADSGFFLEYYSHNKYHIQSITHNGLGSDLAIHPSNGYLNYPYAMRNLYVWLDMKDGINSECITHESNPTNCLFSDYILKYIKTPIFTIQSQYDTWQLPNILGVTTSSGKLNNNRMNNHNITVNDIIKYGRKMIHTIKYTLFQYNTTRHGVYIDSCEHHGTSCLDINVKQYKHWNSSSENDIKNGNINPFYAYYIWYNNIKHNNSMNVSSNSIINYSTSSSRKNSFITTALPSLSNGINWFIQDKTYPCKDCCICISKYNEYLNKYNN